MQLLSENVLGANLIWWRTAGGARTTVTMIWSEVQDFPDPIRLEARLYSADGQQVATWFPRLIPGQPLFIDSDSDGPWADFSGSDGILCLYAGTDLAPSAEARKHFSQLWPIVDWRNGGRVATLHTDQSLRRGSTSAQQFTEIVVLESDEETNALVILNGEEAQAAGSLELTARNAAGISITSTYAPAMQPFTVHSIPLASMFPEVAEFAQGQPVLVSGVFASKGLFTRPYVQTMGKANGVYHGGDLYDWPAVPNHAHMLISGEVNPVAVLHDDQTRTFVNLLHSHGDFEEDMWVSAALFDTEGVCVANHPAWRLVPRHGLARFEISEMLSNPALAFRGHLALGFSPRPGGDAPRRLQALLEIRCADSVTRTMAWSDEWNSKLRLAKRDRRPVVGLTQSYFRVLEDEELTTELSITNAGHQGYDRTADVSVALHGAQGFIGQTTFRLAPFATRMASIEALFPGASNAQGWSGLGVLIVESASDLANIAFTRDRLSGAIAAEHFMGLATRIDGKVKLPAGS